jgi:hypothetical protein
MSGEIQQSKTPEQPKQKSAVRTGLEFILKAAVLRLLGKLWDMIL